MILNDVQEGVSPHLLITDQATSALSSCILQSFAPYLASEELVAKCPVWLIFI